MLIIINMKTPKIIDYGHICLYCGEEIEGRYEDCQQYFECECSDAQKERKIHEQIQKLKDSILREKYSLQQKNVLYKKRN